MTTLQAEMAFSLDLPDGFDRPCEGSKFHSPTPLLTSGVDLAASDLRLPEKGKPKDPVWLCGVCSDNLGVFLQLAESHDFPWEVQRQFGNKIRGLAKRVVAHRGGA